jgi:hypothetical protein
MAAQQRYGVPAAVTIAQAIEESAWGSSGLSAQYHNLFGIKGTGPAGSVSLPTSEYIGGKWESVDAAFRVYHNDAESIADHAELLATSGYYTRAMADRSVPDAFANDLTGVYATDPDYGANLIALMKLYNLYQFDNSGGSSAAATAQAAATPQAAAPADSATHATAPAQATAPASSPASAGTAPSTSAGTGTAPAGGQTAAHAQIPGVAAPALSPSRASSTAAGTTASVQGGTPRIPGLVTPGPLAAGSSAISATPPRSGPENPAIPGTSTIPGAATTPATTATPGTTAAASGTTPATAPTPGTTATNPATAPTPGTTVTAATTAYVTRDRGTATRVVADPVVADRFAPARVAPAAQATSARAAQSRAAQAQVAPAQVAQSRVATARVAQDRVAPGRVTPGLGTPRVARYEPQFPTAVTTAYFASAKAPLARGEHLYRDVAACTGTSWKLLAAVDWMECKADPRYSPVHGEKLGMLNPDGTAYSTKSQALTQCACDLTELAAAVYGIDLTARRPLSVRALAAVFAAFRWGAILQRHGVSPMEFPYSVAGLTAQHQKMHWPNIDAPDAPDRPGGKFREPLGAVTVLLCLGYPATV